MRAEFPAEYLEQEEDILTMAMFPQVAPKLIWRDRVGCVTWSICAALVMFSSRAMARK